MKETDVLVIRMDLLLKRLDERAVGKEVMYDIVKAMDSHMMCEVCGNVGHSGNDYPETHGNTAYINNGFHQLGGQNRWNHQSRPQHQGGNLNLNSIYNSNEPSLKDLFLSQAKIFSIAAHFLLQMVDQSLWKARVSSQGHFGEDSRHIHPHILRCSRHGPQQASSTNPRRPFLNTTNAVLHMGSGHVSFHMQGQTMRCPFNGFNMHRYTENK
jgi:hypothetical protein